MAKTFYNLEEAAEKLGISPEQVREMAQRNEIQKFLNGDKLMFKADQIDKMASGGKEDSAGPIALADSGATDAIKLSDESAAGKTDAIGLSDDTDVADSPAPSKTRTGGKAPPKKDDPRAATGVSVFDADEVEAADPSAQTQVTQPAATDEELALESVGSGSGLLDLTRESDDTSLGAELLDEIYPGGGEGSDAKVDGTGTGTAGATVSGTAPPGSSGVFDGAISLESGPSGLENIQPGEVPMMGAAVMEEAVDPAWSGAVAGAMFGSMITLFIGIFVAFSAIAGMRGPIVESFGKPSSSVMMLSGVLLVITVILAGVGFGVGKAVGGKKA